MRSGRGADALIGAAIGAIGAANGIALPGLLLIGMGFDAIVSLVYALNPSWFPNSARITPTDVLVVGAGTAAGWAAVTAFVPEHIRSNPAVKVAAAAGAVMLPAAGRIPGRLRATYR